MKWEENLYSEKKDNRSYSKKKIRMKKTKMNPKKKLNTYK